MRLAVEWARRSTERGDEGTNGGASSAPTRMTTVTSFPMALLLGQVRAATVAKDGRVVPGVVSRGSSGNGWVSRWVSR